MSATFDLERLVESVLEANGPQTLSHVVIDTAIIRSHVTHQRHPRVPPLDRRAWPGNPYLVDGAALIRGPIVRILILALIAMAIVGLGVAGAALLREDATPKELQSTFFRHFEYAFPVDSAMHASNNADPAMVAWAGGPDTWDGATLDTEDGSSQPHRRQVRGVVIGRGGETWSHGNGGRFMLRTPPAEFLTDLRDTANVPMGPIQQTKLDGRAALTVMLPGTGGTDIHVTGRTQGLGGIYVRVTMPSRLIVSELDGDTVFVFIWARTAQELDKCVPMADEFVTSIHFLPD